MEQESQSVATPEEDGTVLPIDLTLENNMEDFLLSESEETQMHFSPEEIAGESLLFGDRELQLLKSQAEIVDVNTTTQHQIPFNSIILLQKNVGLNFLTFSYSQRSTPDRAEVPCHSRSANMQ